MNGEALYPEQGYPMRLVMPGWQGNLWVKWLRRIKVGDEPLHTREETSKYTDLMPDGRARRFTWVMDAKSVITNPSPQAPPQSQRFYGNLRACLVGGGEDQARRCLARRWTQLAAGPARRPRAR